MSDGDCTSKSALVRLTSKSLARRTLFVGSTVLADVCWGNGLLSLAMSTTGFANAFGISFARRVRANANKELELGSNISFGNSHLTYNFQTANLQFRHNY